MKEVDALRLSRNLLGYLRMRHHSALVTGNIYMPGSPWESDMVKISPSLFYVEYEIKISLADYRNDFKKRLCRYRRNSVTRHDFLTGTQIEQVHHFSKYSVPRPKQFYFVVPRNLLADAVVPAHCGVIEYDHTERSAYGMTVVRTAPSLKLPTKLDAFGIFQVGNKVAHKLRAPDLQVPDSPV